MKLVLAALAALAAALLALAGCGDVTATEQPSPSISVSIARETYACAYEQVLERYGPLGVCEGRDRGQWVRFAAGPDDPRLLDGTHEVTWGARAELPCADAITLVGDVPALIEQAFVDNPADPDAVTDAISAIGDELDTVTKGAAWKTAIAACKTASPNDYAELNFLLLDVRLAAVDTSGAKPTELGSALAKILGDLQRDLTIDPS